jgi:putative transposase
MNSAIIIHGVDAGGVNQYRIMFMTHQRHSTRLSGYDYALPGMYFVTIVAFQRECLFGEVVGGEMRVNDIGFIVESEWRRLPGRFEEVGIDLFILMPNHFHAILQILEVGDPPLVGARQKQSCRTFKPPLASPLPVGPAAGSLGTIIGAFKSTTTRLVNGIWKTPSTPHWQRNYYDHIIRTEAELASIRAYILNNPLRWGLDEENPEKPR